MSETKTSPRRAEIRRVFARHRGTGSKLAAELKISPVTVSMWLRGKASSRRIADAAVIKAIQLLELEKLEKEGQHAA